MGVATSGNDPILRRAADLDEIKLQIAWLYTTAVRALHEAAPAAPRAPVALVQQILAHTEALTSIVERLTVTELDADEAVDVAGVRTRALHYWEIDLQHRQIDMYARELTRLRGATC